MRKLLSTLFLLLLFLNFTFANTGNIIGIVKDSKTQEILIGSTVVIIGTTNGTMTDFNGNFKISNVLPGKYTLKISYVSYTSKEQLITVNSNETTYIEVLLEPNVIELLDVTVTAIKRNDTEISTINTIKTADVVISGISSQLIAKTQDKNASEVIKRLPGVSIVDDKFVIVRGLSSRYNNVWINNSTAPSSEPDTRSFSFDIVPSSIIDNLYIYKSLMAELPADYSGGFIKITTIGIPKENSTSISYGTSFNQYTTFIDFNKELKEEWTPKTIIAIPDQKFTLNINRKYQKNQFIAGNVISLNYSYTNDFHTIINNNYSIYNFKNDQLSLNDEFLDKQYKNSNKIGLLYNWTFYPRDGLKIEFKNFINSIFNSYSQHREGREWYNDGRYIKADELLRSQRLIYTGQLTTQKSFGENNLDLTVGYSLSNKKEPDIRRYRYISDDNVNYLIMFGANPDLSSMSRMNLKLNENLITTSLNYTRNLNIFELKSGIFFETKYRSFNARNFGFETIDNSNIYTTDPINEILGYVNLVQSEITAPSDSYTSTGKILASYINGTLSVNKFNISGGVRVEKDIQTLDSYRQGTTISVNVKRDTINIFPSANISYNINKKNVIRTTYGLSINRPEFREIAPFYFVDFDLNAGIYGNENIKAAYIHNFDLRYEFYPSNDQTFNIGLFYKKFTNPIEVVIRGNNPTQYSFDNVPSAYTYGIETEMRKSLDFIGLDRFSIVSNLSLMKSSISFDRPLQGQSPYIINAGVFYDNEKTDISVMYNRIGKRIYAVGRPSPNEWESIPDIYEMPRNEINATISKQFSEHFSLKIGIRDLLNESIKFEQNVNTDVDMSLYNGEGIQHFDRDQLVRSFNPGRQFFINLSYKF